VVGEGVEDGDARGLNRGDPTYVLLIELNNNGIGNQFCFWLFQIFIFISKWLYFRNILFSN
jgi:hypothetical protein